MPETFDLEVKSVPEYLRDMPTPEEFLMEFLAYFQAVRLVDNSTANQSIVRKFLEEKSK